MKQSNSYSRRLLVKGAPKGYCNICGEFAKLTEDHIPPKSCRGITEAEVRLLHAKLSASGTQPAPRRLQAGPYFRTLCQRCNGLLGTSYDPMLADLSKQVRAIANSALHLPATIPVRVKPQAVMRSVLGHLAAQGLDGYKKEALITEPLKEYVLDPTRSLPPQLRFYFWLYPYRPQVLVKGAAMGRMGGHPPVVFWLMKFFPLAFFVTIENAAMEQFKLPNLDVFRDVAIDAVHEVKLPLRPIPHQLWPENPDDSSFVLYHSDHALLATPLTRVRRT